MTIDQYLRAHPPQHSSHCQLLTGGYHTDGNHFSFPIPGQLRCTCGSDASARADLERLIKAGEQKS